MQGIYKIQNLINYKYYIGKSLNIEERIVRHKYLLNNNKHHNKHLQSAYNKYGFNSFVFEVVEECSSLDINEKEMYYIDYYDAFTNGYNQTLGGDGVGEGEINHRYNPTTYTFYHQKGCVEQNVTMNFMIHKYNLNKSNVWAVVNNVAPSVKGWRITPEKITKIKKYSFANKNSNYKEENITITQMSDKYNLCKTSLRKLTTGRQKNCGGWILINNTNNNSLN